MQLNSPGERNYQELVDKNLSQQIESLAAKSNLTVSQLLLWLGQKLNPNIPLYNMVFHFTIEGKIEPLFFQQAFQSLFNHCDALRLTFTEFEDVPQQQVSQKGKLFLTIPRFFPRRRSTNRCTGMARF